MHLELQLPEEEHREDITAHANSQGPVEERAGGRRKGDRVKIRRGFQKEANPLSKMRVPVHSSGAGSSWYETLLLPFLANARAPYTGAGGSVTFPHVTATWATPSAHLPTKSTPTLRVTHHVTEGEMQENPLISLNRGSLISPPKAFPPQPPRAELECSGGMGPSLSVSACIPRRGVWSPQTPQPAPLPRRPGHNSHL